MALFVPPALSVRMLFALSLGFLSVSHLSMAATISIELPGVRDSNALLSYQPALGYFAQDNETAPGDLGATPPRFGLIDNTEDRWTQFFCELDRLNENGDDSYKLFLLGRHGQGYHNVGESTYGTEAWDAYWSKLNGDGNITWGPDAELTELGRQQADAAKQLWNIELKEADLPIPQAFYTSPLTRAVDTHEITFADITSQKPQTLVLENAREVYGEHTCDKRRTKSYIEQKYPHLAIEESFTEEDKLWTEEREPDGHVIERATKVLDRVFSSTDTKDNFISITAHSGFINAFLQAVGRSKYSLPTGGVLPVVVKATTL